MIKYLLLVVFFFLTQLRPVWAISLQVGDLLLQPLNCRTCTLIEEEEETIYSHIGVVLQVHPAVIVGEAFGSVRQLSLAEFDRKTERGQRLMVLRFRNDRLSEDFQKLAPEFKSLFEAEFQGAPYDSEFRWHNFDENGIEKLYCSELITKLFQAFLRLETPVKRMHFRRNREQWLIYFNGNIPDNQWGNSPADFERSDMFYQLGEL